jgi:flagellar hook-length control protein FliK
MPASPQSQRTLTAGERTSNFADLLAPGERSGQSLGGIEPPSTGSPISRTEPSHRGRLTTTRDSGGTPKSASHAPLTSSGHHHPAEPPQPPAAQSSQENKSLAEKQVWSGADRGTKDGAGCSDSEDGSDPAASTTALTAPADGVTASAKTAAQPMAAVVSPVPDAADPSVALAIATLPQDAAEVTTNTDVAVAVVAAASSTSTTAAAGSSAAFLATTPDAQAAITSAQAPNVAGGSLAAAAAIPAAVLGAEIADPMFEPQNLRPKAGATDLPGNKLTPGATPANGSASDSKSGVDQGLPAGPVQSAPPDSGKAPTAPAPAAISPVATATSDQGTTPKSERPAKAEDAAAALHSPSQPAPATTGNAMAAMKAAADSLHPLISAAFGTQPSAATPTTIGQAAAEIAVSRAVPLAGVAIEIATQLQASKQSFGIRLDPPDLGRIDVHLHVDRDGNVSSRLVVERPETLDLLRRDAPQLERALQQAGLKTADNALQFSLRDHNGARQDNTPLPNTHRLILADETGGDGEPAPATPSYGRLLGLGSGIDIRI